MRLFLQAREQESMLKAMTDRAESGSFNALLFSFSSCCAAAPFECGIMLSCISIFITTTIPAAITLTPALRAHF